MAEARLPRLKNIWPESRIPRLPPPDPQVVAQIPKSYFCFGPSHADRAYYKIACQLKLTSENRLDSDSDFLQEITISLNSKGPSIRRGQRKISTKKQIAKERFLRRKIEPDPTLVNATSFSFAAYSETIRNTSGAEFPSVAKSPREKNRTKQTEIEFPAM